MACCAEHKEEALEALSDSFEDLGAAISVVGALENTTNLTASQKNSARLRECTNPTFLTAVLADVWTPDDAESKIPLMARQGIVQNLDLSELVLFAEGICKKLISFAVCQEAEHEARCKAIDVLTWLSSCPQVLHSPYRNLQVHVHLISRSRLLNGEKICKWFLHLAASKDPSVALAGLRGIRNIASLSAYRSIPMRNKKLVAILKGIKIEKEWSVQHAVYIFMICEKLLKVKTNNKLCEAIQTKMKEILQSTPSEASELHKWCKATYQLVTIFSPKRIQLIEKDGRVGAISFSDELLEARVDLYSELGQQLRAMELDNWMKQPRFIAKLFSRMENGSEDQKLLALDLIVDIAMTIPSVVYRHFLDDNWNTLVCILLKREAKQVDCILDVLHAMSKLPRPDKRKSVALPDGGRALIKFLLEALNEDKADTLFFLWHHYAQVMHVFLTDGMLKDFFLALFKLQDSFTSGFAKKLKGFLSGLFQDQEANQEKIQEQLIACFRVLLSADDLLYASCNLCLLLDVLAKALDKPDVVLSVQLAEWFISEGLEGFYAQVSLLNERQLKESSRMSLFRILKPIFNARSCQAKQRNFFVNKFLTAIQAADVFCSFNIKLQLFGTWSWEAELNATGDSDCLSFPTHAKLGVASMTLLQEMIICHASKPSKTLCFLLKVLYAVGLKDISANCIRQTGTLRCIVRLLEKWTPSDSWECVSEALLLCAKRIANRAKVPFVQELKNSGKQTMDNLFSLFIQLENSILLFDSGRKDLLLVLKDMHCEPRQTCGKRGSPSGPML